MLRSSYFTLFRSGHITRDTVHGMRFKFIFINLAGFAIINFEIIRNTLYKILKKL